MIAEITRKAVALVTVTAWDITIVMYVNGASRKRKETMSNDYKQGDTIYILMTAMSAQGLLEDWLQHNYECDLHLHRSKQNKGMVVVETKDLMWASRIIKWHKCEKVTYKTK